MKYTIYIASHCTDCDQIAEYLDNHDFPVEVLDLDRSSAEAPSNVYVVPALLEQGRILAYGKQDIIRLLEKRA